MAVLSSELRSVLEVGVVAGRRASEAAARAAIGGLGVFEDRRPEHLDEERARLRVGLRAKWRQLGGDRELLFAECAYEQWHRLLFARFLAENNLLLHPEFGAPVTLEECEELAPELGEPDGWSVAGRFAAEILPGIFRLDDPCVQLRLAPEGRDALEQILAGLNSEVFHADDALGWVYQYWQKEKKNEVNRSERKIGGADLGPVTQLFTEHYMVRFLLENSLGAWWAARHPQSPLVETFDYLRLDEDDVPAAGQFDSWPDSAADVTVIDPCCGSGHFLVEAFSMLWQMRAEEEALSPIEAQDAVLRDNLFGLELDARCVQIAMVAVALQAWKSGHGWRKLPVPNIACSGIPVKTPIEEWLALSDGSPQLEQALHRLHGLFQEADTLGSLIDPVRVVSGDAQGSFDDAAWEDVERAVTRAISKVEDPAARVLAPDLAGAARSARFLCRRYTLAATNVPYLGRSKQSEVLRNYCAARLPDGQADLGLAFVVRMQSLAETWCPVIFRNWFISSSARGFRKRVSTSSTLLLIADVGSRGFSESLFEFPLALLVGGQTFEGPARTAVISCGNPRSSQDTASALRAEDVVLSASPWGPTPDFDLNLVQQSGPRLGAVATSVQGLKTGDNPRFLRGHWEVPRLCGTWEPILSPVNSTQLYGGRSDVVRWEEGSGELALSGQARIQGQVAWARKGILIREISPCPATVYLGEIFQSSGIAVVPTTETDLPAMWEYAQSPGFARDLRRIDPKTGIATSSLTKLPFDAELWHDVAAARYPEGLPEPFSADPTQWLFDGRPDTSTAPLHVAVARLLGYRWPEQSESDDLNVFGDTDGIVCLPSVAQESPAATRLEDLLRAAYGDQWSPNLPGELLEQAGSKKNLADWLRDEFFKQHCSLFGHRPFVWNIWDGLRDGFSALVNYHRLDRHCLEKLTYTYLGQDWVERQRAAARDEEPGAGQRLAAALELQRKLEAILEGEPPLDIYVRWKPLHEQPLGWEPDVDDGVRMNVRPFVEAGVLRSKFNVHWRTDRGKNPDGSERQNDLHYMLAEKQVAREEAA